ncbi:Bug family tripartite tricarboxylate transporter substrate binding protein [Nesterenkonia aerolata]|uniref:Tripartite tricarboxylate transporter substrate binding protein n=1 Tax=Nesterenkonia aerolata TaxID=3074079 RepID=A0ABU2DTW9_9MICC|nr:tripartite tricarboxylate transporter substrate binding protein [Nesterenkonia sp. LY-0111]MDR8019949.1 tripartite tricarboxylate transporter substrate binding protein [Nesterenkonia sp. LY-0111]
MPQTVAASAAAAVLLTACVDGGDPQSEGTNQINLVVPFAPGGSADGTARQLATEAEQTCGKDVVVRNETGGSGTVGFQSVASAPADGTTIGVAAIELSILPHLGVSPIEPADVRGIMQYSEQPVAFGVPEDSDIENVDELLTTDEDITVASSGTGSIYHIGFAGAAQAAEQPNLRNVPYSGAATAVQATLGEETDMVTVGAAEMAPYVEDGQLRPLAVAGDEQVDILPETPTLEEVGLDWTSYAILGLFAPQNTPDDVIGELNECLDEARRSDSFSSYMDTLGFTQEYKDAEEFDAFLQEEYERYGDVVEQAGLGEQ